MAAVSPLSLYVHVPFCRAKCGYCDFYSHHYDEDTARRFVGAVAREWLIVKDRYNLGGARVQTLYFGGGTPGMLPPALWERLRDGLVRSLHLAPGTEWTVECNPDSFSSDKARLWLDLGVTRLTLGVQSLDEGELRLLGRPHSGGEALEALDDPALAGFRSVGVDLIYGLPGQTPESLRRSLRGVLTRPVVAHLSAYELTLHEGTPLGDRRATLDLPDEETVLAMMRIAIEECARHGLERYEISNYARQGHQCRHNIAYWTHAPYVGLGPAAHSFLPPLRVANVSDTGAYCDAIERGDLARAFEETLDSRALGREAIFLGLRTVEGIHERRFKELTDGEFASPERRTALDELQAAGLIARAGPYWRCTEAGLRVADGVARRLIGA